MLQAKLVSNHGVVLVYIARHGDRTLEIMAGDLGLSERAIRKIIGDLAATQLLRKERVGRTLHYVIQGNTRLNHEGLGDATVNDFLRGLVRDRLSAG